MNTTGNNKSVLNRFNKLAGLALALAPTLWSSALAGPVLQGQNKGDTVNWYMGNLQGWGELEYIPLRVYFAAGSAGNQTVHIDFPHLNGKLFGFEDLAAFAPATPNLAFTSAPVLTTGSSGVWSYTFSVNVSDANPAEVRFFARMASGAHLNGGSSLSDQRKRRQRPNSQARPGLGRTQSRREPDRSRRRARGCDSHLHRELYQQGADLSRDGRPAQPDYRSSAYGGTASLGPNAHIVGNTIFWDSGNLPPQASGRITFLAMVNPTAPIGLVMTNVAQVYSAENDLDMQDNLAATMTSVSCGTAAAAIVANPVNVTVCPGEPATFSTSATGPGQLTYQWRKDGVPIAGATSTSFTIGSVGSADLGTYDVLVTSPCDVVVSGTAVLSFRPGLPLSITGSRFEADGAFVIEFGTLCGGTYVVEYSADLKT